MGNSQTKEEPNFDSGIYVTPGLVAQLQGKAARRKGPASKADVPSRSPTLEQAVVERMKQDQDLRQAYEESKLAGELLLKREGDELSRVHQFADELMQREYRVPSKGPPCQPERSKVTECYKENLRDPLVCASLVDAYASCADEARRAFTQSQIQSQRH